jgi:hypothetical protein
MNMGGRRSIDAPALWLLRGVGILLLLCLLLLLRGVIFHVVILEMGRAHSFSMSMSLDCVLCDTICKEMCAMEWL